MKQPKISSQRFSLLGLLLINFLTSGESCSTKIPHVKAIPKLKAVSMLFRHGDKSPAYTYPLDPYKDYPWPGGFGALSLQGAQQLYQSGLVKSTRYSSLLSLECPPNEFCKFDIGRISVLSSSTQRCVNSAKNFLNGFLRVNWSSDSVGVLPQNEDEMLAIEGKSCPKYSFDKLLSSLPLTSLLFSHIIDFGSQEGEDILEYLRNNTGLPLTDILQLGYLEDTLLIEHNSGLVLPEWTNSVWQQYLRPLSDKFFRIMGNLDYMKTRSGVLLKDKIDRLKAFTQGSSDQNILVYSGHDITLASLLYALNITDQIGSRPTYGSSLNFELYQNAAIRNDFEMRIVYFRDYADTNPMQINIPRCRAPCAFMKFVQTYSSLLISSYDATCQL